MHVSVAASDSCIAATILSRQLSFSRKFCVQVAIVSGQKHLGKPEHLHLRLLLFLKK